MPRTRPPYSEGIRQQMVELVRSGRTPEELAKEFEPSGNTIRNWVRKADRMAKMAVLVREPYPDLLGRLSRLRSLNSLRRAIQDWVPHDFTCFAGSTTDDMAFPPELFSDLTEKDVEQLGQTFGIPRSRKFSTWACHYFEVNVHYRDHNRRRGMAKRLADGVRSVPVRESSSPLPTALCLFLVTYASMEQHESEWRSDIASVIKEDAERNACDVRRVLKASDQISAYLHCAESRVRRPGDLLTTSGNVDAWGNRMRFLDLLVELQEILRTDPMALALRRRLRDDTSPLAYTAWGAVRDLANRHMTKAGGGDVASELMSMAGLEIKPDTAARILRRADNPP